MADPVTFFRDDSFRPHWLRDKGAKVSKRCIRRGDGGHVFWNDRIVQLVPPGEKAWLKAAVYTVKISSERLARWPKQPASYFVVATSSKAVETYLSKRYAKVAEKSSGMAQHVLGLAMGEVSTRPPANPRKLGRTAAKRARDFMRVIVSDGGNNYRVRIESNLSYAMSAVKGGSAGVNDALKRAANSVAGMIRHRVGERLAENLSTPFPEVKRK